MKLGSSSFATELCVCFLFNVDPQQIWNGVRRRGIRGRGQNGRGVLRRRLLWGRATRGRRHGPPTPSHGQRTATLSVIQRTVKRWGQAKDATLFRFREPRQTVTCYHQNGHQMTLHWTELNCFLTLVITLDFLFVLESGYGPPRSSYGSYDRYDKVF